jgi:hypothetical protein
MVPRKYLYSLYRIFRARARIEDVGPRIASVRAVPFPRVSLCPDCRKLSTFFSMEEAIFCRPHGSSPHHSVATNCASV